MAQSLYSLAAIAPGLSEAELRTCLYLATIQDPHTRTVRASSRQIEAGTRLARASVQRALDSLARRCLIATRQGTTTRAASYLLNWTQTTSLGGGLTMRPPVQPALPGVASPVGHPSQPPIDISMGSMDSTIDRNTDILDRVLTARPQHYQRGQIDLLKRYAYKWLTLQRGQQHAHPPDDFTIAQIATAAGGTQPAHRFILDNLQDRQAESCQYLVSMLLQKLHGISPSATKARRAELKAFKKQQVTGDTPVSNDPDFPERLLQNAIQAVKKMR